MKKLFTLILLLCVSSLFSQNIAINEVVSGNTTLLTDEDNTYQDFIEIYNYDTVSINLEGFGLSDDVSLPYKWVFPSITILPNTYMLIWASDKNRINPTQPLHTNFKISASGENIILTHSNGNTLNIAPPTSLTSNTSLGRLPNGFGLFQVFQNPTPNQANIAEPSPVSPPVFSHTSGFYNTASLNLEISHPNSNAIIIYTTDGSEPDINNLNSTTYQHKNIYPAGPFITKSFQSNIYSNSLNLQNKTSEVNKLSTISTTLSTSTPTYFPSSLLKKANVIRAKAYINGVSSSIVSHTYFISDNNTFNHSIPVVSIITNENKLFDYNDGIYVAGIDYDTNIGNNECGIYNWTRDVELKANFQYFVNQQNIINQNIGLKLHGGCTKTYPFKSFRLYARAEYDTNNNFNYQFFDEYNFNNFKRLILRNSGNDAGSSFFRDAFMQKLVEHLNFETQKYQPSVVYLNGEYFSILNIRERYDEYYLERKYNLNENEIDLLQSDGTNNLNILNGDNIHWTYLYNYISTNDLSINNNFNHLKTLIDDKSFMDYQIANTYIRNTDWPHNNIKYYRKKTSSYSPNSIYAHDGRWRWLMYDTDSGFGLDSTYGGTYQKDMIAWITNPNGNDRLPTGYPWINKLMISMLENQQFKLDFINRYADLLNTAFLPQRAISIINDMENVISNEIFNQQTRWASPANWSDKVQVMRDFALQRPNYTRQHILNNFNLAGMYNLTLQIANLMNTPPDDAPPPPPPAYNNVFGYIKVNTIDINPETPGVAQASYPWSGIYFKNVPVTLTPTPYEGYTFSHWAGDLTSVISTNGNTITINPTTDVQIIAHFVPVVTNYCNTNGILYYWFMGNQIENDTPLTQVAPLYQNGENGMLNYTSSMGVGYPFTSSDPNWRKGSMERRNSPTDLNYISEANSNITFNNSSMKGLQIKQPFEVGSNQNEMIFNVSTKDYHNLIFKFVAKDEGTGLNIIADYKVDNINQWTNVGLNNNNITLSNVYAVQTLDFSAITTVNDNSNFKIRLRFTGSNSSIDTGKRITFNNISLTGNCTPVTPPLEISLVNVGSFSSSNTSNKDGWLYFENPTEPNKYIFAIQPNPANGNTLSTNNYTITVSNTGMLNSFLQNGEGLFQLQRYFKIETNESHNEKIRVRFYFDNTEFNTLNTEASTYANTFNAALSPLFISLFTQNYQINNSYYLGFNMPFITAQNITYGVQQYPYVEFDIPIHQNQNYSGVFIKKTSNNSSNLFTQPGTIRYNATLNKLQGWTGTEWVNFH